METRKMSHSSEEICTGIRGLRVHPRAFWVYSQVYQGWLSKREDPTATLREVDSPAAPNGEDWPDSGVRES